MTICIFASAPHSVEKYITSSASDPPMITLCDPKNNVYEAYQVILASGMKLFRAGVELMNMRKYKNFVAWDDNSKEGSVKQLPAVFLIEENGVVTDIFRAETFSGTIPFDRVESFIPEEKRCRCNKQHCLHSKCRNNYEDIRRDSAIFMG